MAMVVIFSENLREHLSLQRMLRSSGYDVVATDDPAYFCQVLTLIHVDLVVMADMAGMSLLRAIRAEGLCDLPAVLIGRAHQVELAAAARELKAKLYISNRGELGGFLECVEYEIWPEAFTGMWMSYQPA